MAGSGSTGFHAGDWLVEPDAGRVSRGDEAHTLRPREMDLLVYLAERPGQVVRTDDIMQDVWSGVEVTNDSLYFSISQLRKVLDDKSSGRSLIETIPKRGYRLTVPVTVVDAAAEPVPADLAEPATDERPMPVHDGDPGMALPPRQPVRLRYLPALAVAILVVAGVAWFATLGNDSPPDADAVAEALPATNASSIAVMPFIDLTPEADYTYFSDGITEEILNRLTRVPGLQVAARTSSFRFKDSADGVVEIGRTLGVANLLEGSVRKEGDRIRVSVQLIDAESGFQLWSGSYDRQLTSVFEIQNEISRHVADALQITFAANGESGGDKSEQPASASVVEQYLLGLEAYRTQSFESLQSAADYFESVLEQDPLFSSARVQLASTYLQLLNTGATDDKGLLDQADTLLNAAIATNPEDAAAHRVMGLLKLWQKEPEEARRELDLALSLSPSDSEALTYLASVEGASGNPAKARELLQRAVRIDPFSGNVLHIYAEVERMFGATGNAREALQRAVEFYPDNPNSIWMLGKLQTGGDGRLADGLASFLAAAELDTNDYEIAAFVAATYQTLGMLEAAEPWVARAERDAPNAATTQALKAIAAALEGRTAAAAEIAESALRDKADRFAAHVMLTRSLLYLSILDVTSPEQAEAAVTWFADLVPEDKMSREALPEVDSLDMFLAFSELPRSRLVTLGTLYKIAGMDEERLDVLDRLAVTRLSAIGEFRDRPLSDDYLLEAEARALEGDVDGAFEMLETAIDENAIYLWQVTYELNPVFADLRNDGRWAALIERLRARIESERQVADTMLGMAARQNRIYSAVE